MTQRITYSVITSKDLIYSPSNHLFDNQILNWMYQGIKTPQNISKFRLFEEGK